MRNGNGARDAVIISGWRTPFGKRGGQFSGLHPVEMLSFTLKALIERTGINPELVEDVIGGCVGQVGEQALNVTRSAWLGISCGAGWVVTLKRRDAPGEDLIEPGARDPVVPQRPDVGSAGVDLVALGLEQLERRRLHRVVLKLSLLHDLLAKR